MTDFIKSLSSPSWWIGVVLVSLLINLASAYVKSPLDDLFSRMSRWWANRSASAKAKRVALVASLAADKHKQLLYLAAESRCRFRELLWVALASLFLLIIALDPVLANRSRTSLDRELLSYVAMVMLLVSMISSLSQRLEAIRLASLVREANRVER